MVKLKKKRKTMNGADTTRNAIILGALLHDIGKFVQRAKKNPKKQDHQKWGLEWFFQKEGLRERLRVATIFSNEELGIIDSAITSHHNWVEYISLADAISAGMERITIEEEEKGDPFSDRLISIFSRISISDKPKKDMYHNLTYLGKENLCETFPIDEKKCTTQEYSELLAAFNPEIEQLNFKDFSPQSVITKIYFLLWKYTWCIPSAAYEDEPDISLFDHLKTTSAIAGCLYDYHQENPNETLTIGSQAFLLVAGDVSGIQDYIFEVLTEEGKIAKRLRARSLSIQLVSEIASHQILHEFNLPLLNLITFAGGNFQILIPNLKNAKNKLEELQKKFDDWTIDNFNAEISVNLASIVLSGRDLCDFSKVIEKLKQALPHKKYQPFKSSFVSNGKWKSKIFLRPEVIEGDEKVCKGCYKNPVIKQNEENLCNRCLNDSAIGGILPKANYIAFFKKPDRKFVLFDYSFELWAKFKENPEAYLIFALNNPLEDKAGFKYLCKYIPTDENKPITFDKIAEKSEGDKLLGYLKADVDNMGKILKRGFQKTKPSISRFVSLSRMLETFFAGYLQKKLEDEFKDIYTVFSGGDDFFVIGPWNRVIEFAKTMRSEFDRFTGNNPDFTFSAGIILAKHHEPIPFCTEKVNEALDKSKSKENKDSVTLFDQTFNWQILEEVLTKAEWIIEKFKKEPPDISRSIIYRFRQYGEMAIKSGICEKGGEIKTQYLKFVPLLTYDINRNLTQESQKEIFEWAESLKPNRDLVVGKDLPYLKTIMEYVLTYTRGDKNGEKM